MDIELFYREKGSGEPLILRHGNGEDGSGARCVRIPDNR